MEVGEDPVHPTLRAARQVWRGHGVLEPVQQNADAAEGLGRRLAHRVERRGEHVYKVVQLLLGDVEGCLAAQHGGDEEGAGRKGDPPPGIY